MLKKYLRFLPFILLFLNLSIAQAGEREWPEMMYEGGDQKTYQLVPVTKIPAESLITSTTALLSDLKVCKLYENGERYTQERTIRLLNRITPRTKAWMEGSNEHLPWAYIQSLEKTDLELEATLKPKIVGFLGVHLHTDDTLKEYKGAEICYALSPAYQGRGILTRAFETYARTFSSQLNTLGEKFNRILAPISPRNFPSLSFTFRLGFTLGKEGSDAPYISGYFPNYISNEETPRLLSISEQVVEKFQETSAKDLKRQDIDRGITEEEWEKLKAVRVVAVMPKEIFFHKYLNAKNNK